MHKNGMISFCCKLDAHAGATSQTRTQIARMLLSIAAGALRLHQSEHVCCSLRSSDDVLPAGLEKVSGSTSTTIVPVLNTPREAPTSPDQHRMICNITQHDVTCCVRTAVS
jgi:hypothetical protein